MKAIFFANDIVYARFQGFNNFSVRFDERCSSFRALSIVGECISRHLFSFGGLRTLRLVRSCRGFVRKRLACLCG